MTVRTNDKIVDFEARRRAAPRDSVSVTPDSAMALVNLSKTQILSQPATALLAHSSLSR